MRHYIHQLVANCVCLLFGAEQAVYSEFLQLTAETAPAAAESDDIRTMSMNQNSKVVGRTAEQWAETHCKAT